MKINKKQLSNISSDRNKVFGAALIFVLISITGLLFFGKSTYSIEEGIDGISIVCPSTVSKGDTAECNLTLNSVTMTTYGITGKYDVTDGIQFVEFVSDSWEITSSEDDGFVLVNLDGVSGTDNLVGTVKYTVPTDAVDNSVYVIGLTDVTIGDGEDTVLELNDVSSEIRVKSDVNTLENITLSNGVLNEEFDKNVSNYTSNIENDKVIITTSKTDSNSVVSGDGEVSLHYGTNTINIVVTSESGVENTYTLKIYRDYKLSSDVYKYSEEKKYIYTDTESNNDFILNNVNIPDELSGNIENNKLVISYNDEVLKEYNLVSIRSQKYDLNKDYIYIGTNDMDTGDIDTINSDGIVDGNKLLIKYGDEVLREITILSLDFGTMNVENNAIKLSNDVLYSEFIQNVTVSENVSYIVYNGDEEVSTGNVTNGMILKIYYNEVLLDSYNISVYSFEFNQDVTVDKENKYIKYLTENTTVSEFLNNTFTTNGEYQLYDKKGNLKDSNNIIKTGDVLKIYLNNELKEEYTLSILGDLNGDGKFNITDLAQARKHLLEWKDEEGNVYVKQGVYREAFDFNDDGKIDIRDLARMRKKMLGLI